MFGSWSQTLPTHVLPIIRSVGCIMAEMLGNRPLFPGYAPAHCMPTPAHCMPTPAHCMPTPATVIVWLYFAHCSNVYTRYVLSHLSYFVPLIIPCPTYHTLSSFSKNYVDQLNRILEITGSPSAEDLAAIPNEKSRRYVQVRSIKPHARKHACPPPCCQS